jgi:hypothetical protein
MRKTLLSVLAILAFFGAAKFTWEVMDFAASSVEDEPAWSYPEAEFRSTALRLSASRWECSGTGCLEDGDILRLSWEIHKNAEDFGFVPSKIFGILMVENPWLDSTAVSPAGAVGLMQVMPFHAGNWEGCGSNLVSVSGNLCHSLSILDAYSLLKYNGCTLAYCRGYVEKVQNAF